MKMILVNTSVWVRHFREGDLTLNGCWIMGKCCATRSHKEQVNPGNSAIQALGRSIIKDRK